ncbi:MAG: hypothetical protein ACOY91_05325 [Pseudomonadota bacterium]|jgi:hypothetical protein
MADQFIRCSFNRQVVLDSVSKPLAAVLKSVTVGMTAALVVFALLLIVPLFGEKLHHLPDDDGAGLRHCHLALILTAGKRQGRSAFCAHLQRPS